MATEKGYIFTTEEQQALAESCELSVHALQAERGFTVDDDQIYSDAEQLLEAVADLDGRIRLYEGLKERLDDG